MSNSPGAQSVLRLRHLGRRRNGALRELSFGDLGKDGSEHLLNLRIDIGLLAQHLLRIQSTTEACFRLLAGRWTNASIGHGSPAAIGQRSFRGSDQSKARFVLAIRRRLAMELGRATALLDRERPPYPGKRVLENAESFRTGTGPRERSRW